MLIRGGTVVDGTGAPARRADVRLKGDRIAAIGPGLRPEGGEAVLDAGGAYVVPGLIDCHTHFDAPMFWGPKIDPLPGYGSTSAIIGNCGFSIAPMPADAEGRDSIVGVFSYIEDIPRPSFESALPWDWSDWPSYAARLAALPKAVNVGALIGHLNLRITAMGAAAWDRAASAAEVGAMAVMLDEALRAGALGLSTNFQNVDSRGLPLPTLLADDAELEALLDVLARHPGRILQFNNSEELEPALAATRRMARLAGPRGVRLQYLHLPAEARRVAEHGVHVEMVARMRADGVDVWPAFLHRPVSVQLSLESCIVFRLIAMVGWHILSNETAREDKAALLADPAWRARCRQEWDAAPHLGLRDTGRYLFRNSANGTGPVGGSLTDLVGDSGRHPSDVLADWWLANGIDSTVHLADEPMNVEGVVGLVRDPRALGGVNDAGAHGQLFCGAGESASLFTRYVRGGLLSVEEVVHLLTGRIAGHFSLDRGILKPGAVADVAVFALDEIEQRQEVKVWDVPDGSGGTTWRWSRPPAPFRATVVAGQVTFDAARGQTDALPGRLLRVG